MTFKDQYITDVKSAWSFYAGIMFHFGTEIIGQQIWQRFFIKVKMSLIEPIHDNPTINGVIVNIAMYEVFNKVLHLSVIHL